MIFMKQVRHAGVTQHLPFENDKITNDHHAASLIHQMNGGALPYQHCKISKFDQACCVTPYELH